MTAFHKPVPRWHVVARPERFHQPMPRWLVVARIAFELVPDFSERLFLWGDNVRVARCSLTGEGTIQFWHPLRSPELRAFTRGGLEPVRLLEVTQYGARFKAIEWPLDSNRIEEFVFESQLAA
jgi:hypothetical protein